MADEKVTLWRVWNRVSDDEDEMLASFTSPEEARKWMYDHCIGEGFRWLHVDIWEP